MCRNVNVNLCTKILWCGRSGALRGLEQLSAFVTISSSIWPASPSCSPTPPLISHDIMAKADMRMRIFLEHKLVELCWGKNYHLPNNSLVTKYSMCVQTKKGVLGKSLVIGTRVGHSVSVYADSFGYAHIYSKKQKYPDIRIFPISQHKHNVFKAKA